MNFPSKITLAKVAVAAAAGATMTMASSAQAAQLTGLLNINGSVRVNNAANATKFEFLDANGSTAGTNFNIGFSDLGFDGTPGILTGIGVIKTPLNLTAGGTLPAGPGIDKFISGLFLNGKALSFDLTSFTRGIPEIKAAGKFSNSYFYNSVLSGVFKVGASYAGEGSLTSTFTILKTASGIPAVGSYGANLVPTEQIPTPALLPGLIALGAGVLRKRKAEAAAEAEA